MKVALSNTNFPFVSTQFNIRSALCNHLYTEDQHVANYFCLALLLLLFFLFSYLTCFLFLRLITRVVTAMKSFFFHFFTSWVILIAQ